jgi:hypothetical protein
MEIKPIELESAGPTVTHKNQTEYHQMKFQTCSYTLLPKKSATD